MNYFKMRIFKNIPKIYRGPIYILFAVDWWLLGKLTLFKPLPPGIYRTDLVGLEIPIFIYFAVLLALSLFGIIYTIQGILNKIKKNKKVQ